MQTKRGGIQVPPEERGDCLPAAIASLLEVPIEAVPIPHSDEVHWWDVTQAAVEAHGYNLVIADAECWPWGYWLAAIPSLNLTRLDGTRESHIVVMRGHELVHDPALGHRYKQGTPIEELEIREAYVLAPTDPVSKAA